MVKRLFPVFLMLWEGFRFSVLMKGDTGAMGKLGNEGNDGGEAGLFPAPRCVTFLNHHDHEWSACVVHQKEGT
jgi:hypothetical protein